MQSGKEKKIFGGRRESKTLPYKANVAGGKNLIKKERKLCGLENSPARPALTVHAADLGVSGSTT